VLVLLHWHCLVVQLLRIDAAVNFVKFLANCWEALPPYFLNGEHMFHCPCFYCKKKGHVMTECWKREKNSQWLYHIIYNQHLIHSRLIPLSPHEQFNPFVSKGSVSLSDGGDQVPITILRDTGATQGLIVEGILPLSAKETATGATMLIQGVGLVPLHSVFLCCGLFTRLVVVGTWPSLPVQWISL